ncbi:MAG: hypothetical protein U0894_08540 [Pirellulales bacterium]
MPGLFHTYGLETVYTYFSVFGPQQDPNGPYAAVIPLFVQKLLRGGTRILGMDCRRVIFATSKTWWQQICSRLSGLASVSEVFNVGGGSQSHAAGAAGKIKVTA